MSPPPPKGPAPARLDDLMDRARAALGAGSVEAGGAPQDLHAVGITLEGEIRRQARTAGVGLELYGEGVRLAAQALVRGGAPGRAAKLMQDAGLWTQAAELAEMAGEVDLLEAALGARLPAEARTHQAALAFSAYERFLAQGELNQARTALATAQKARPDNPAYPGLMTALLQRLPRRLVLQHDGHRLTVAHPPATLGRSVDAAFIIQAPRVARHHATLTVEGGAIRLLDPAGRCLWDEASGSAEVALGKVFVRLERAGGGAFLHLDDASLGVVPPGGRLELDPVGLGGAWLGLEWAEGGFPRLRVEGLPARVDEADLGPAGRDLARGMTLRIGARRFLVVGE